MEEVENKYEENKGTEAKYYNRNAKDLNHLKMKDPVYIQDHISKRWNKTGEVVGLGKNRKYLIKLKSGSLLWKNRIHLMLRKILNS